MAPTFSREHARSRRLLQRRSLRDVAALAGIPFPSLHRWENGRGELTTTEVEAVRRALDDRDGAIPLSSFARELSRVAIHGQRGQELSEIATAVARVSSPDSADEAQALATEHTVWLNRVNDLAARQIKTAEPHEEDSRS